MNWQRGSEHERPTDKSNQSFHSSEVAREKNLKTFIVVSDPYHLRRAMRMAEALGLDAHASGTPTSKRNDLGFLLGETRRNATFLLRRALFRDAEARELAVNEH